MADHAQSARLVVVSPRVSTRLHIHMNSFIRTLTEANVEEITINRFCRRVDELGWQSLVVRKGLHLSRAEISKLHSETPGSRLVKITSVSSGGRVAGGRAKPSYDVMVPPAQEES